jgi:signal transduction histidine kinase
MAVPGINDAHNHMLELGLKLGRLALDDCASIAELVERVRAAGVPVTLEQPFPDDAVPLAYSLTAFRIVQEALTNVRRHAGSPPTRVTLDRDGDTLIVEVVNAGGPAAPPRPGGRGLVGMRERAELYGGTLTAAPGPEGGWRVRAELPLEADPQEAVIAGAQRPLDT